LLLARKLGWAIDRTASILAAISRRRLSRWIDTPPIRYPRDIRARRIRLAQLAQRDKSSSDLAENGVEIRRSQKLQEVQWTAHDLSQDVVFAENQTIPMQSMSKVDLFHGLVWASPHQMQRFDLMQQATTADHSSQVAGHTHHELCLAVDLAEANAFQIQNRRFVCASGKV
jgi:hypothetical protein